MPKHDRLYGEFKTEEVREKRPELTCILKEKFFYSPE